MYCRTEVRLIRVTGCRIHSHWRHQRGVQFKQTIGEYGNRYCVSKDIGELGRYEVSQGDIRGESCRHGTQHFCDQTNPDIVSVDHSGELYDSPKNASCSGSTTVGGRQIDGQRLGGGTYSCSGVLRLTFHILSFTQSISHPAQMVLEMNWPNNFGTIQPTSHDDKAEAPSSIPINNRKIMRGSMGSAWGPCRSWVGPRVVTVTGLARVFTSHQKGCIRGPSLPARVASS